MNIIVVLVLVCYSATVHVIFYELICREKAIASISSDHEPSENLDNFDPNEFLQFLNHKYVCTIFELKLIILKILG